MQSSRFSRNKFCKNIYSDLFCFVFFVSKMEVSKDDFVKYNLPQNPQDFENIDVLEPTFGKIESTKNKYACGYGSYSSNNSNREGNSSSYALFFREMQPFIRKEMPNATFGMLSKLIAAKWDTLDEKYKKEYRRRSAKAKRDKLREMAMFKVKQLCSTPTTTNLPQASSYNPLQSYQQSQTFLKNIYQQKK